mmetsp:Transcript_20817/g.34325  ORF Transcript_20817/g.34325 Transcript_20817/m.34325 type:complete len:296 (-) Transcript_20817:444-1331(-)|eukprot:CAMPEP_0119310890 /NCGR_PEP_ID=MMETSP1333-20130426/20690_1 /TAXON_ID=418940 /ORGANISM="Scyphosphaera apsteinii, Strain RCC1455" /LENGTH=295 /DNA_ID=CAMNT_0007315153 /DNA_START=67 /DNA_END=954 /DNA_ORIENTATION=-
MLTEQLLGGMTRDLEAARNAYASGNVQASKSAHDGGIVKTAMEAHEEGGGQVKSIVFGGLDGILTSFAIVAGAVGAHLSPVAILAMGVSNVLADALSMGAGEFLSSRAYSNYVKKEQEREAWELENYPEGEVDEMVALFVKRGMSQEDAEVVINRMAKYKTFFVNLMMREELSLPVPGDDDGVMDSVRDGAVMFCSFAIFGMLPIAGFAVVPLLLPGLTDHTLFTVACFITALALLTLGAFKARFHDKYDYKQYFRSGFETLLLGGACAAVAFLVGRTVATFAEDSLGDLYISTW